MSAGLGNLARVLPATIVLLGHGAPCEHKCIPFDRRGHDCAAVCRGPSAATPPCRANRGAMCRTGSLIGSEVDCARVMGLTVNCAVGIIVKLILAACLCIRISGILQFVLRYVSSECVFCMPRAMIFADNMISILERWLVVILCTAGIFCAPVWMKLCIAFRQQDLLTSAHVQGDLCHALEDSACGYPHTK